MPQYIRDNNYLSRAADQIQRLTNLLSPSKQNELNSDTDDPITVDEVDIRGSNWREVPIELLDRLYFLTVDGIKTPRLKSTSVFSARFIIPPDYSPGNRSYIRLVLFGTSDASVLPNEVQIRYRVTNPISTNQVIDMETPYSVAIPVPVLTNGKVTSVLLDPAIALGTENNIGPGAVLEMAISRNRSTGFDTSYLGLAALSYCYKRLF